MKNLRKILFFALFVGSLTIYLTSCDKSAPIVENATNVNFEKSNRERFVPEEEIDKFLVDWIHTYKTAFDWDNAPDNMLHSALMYGDSILTIDFKVGASTDKREFYRQNRTLPSDWIKERKSIIDYILAEEKSYRGNERINVEDLLPFPLDNRLAVIDIKITNPSTISNLRAKYYVSLGTSYLPPNLRLAQEPGGGFQPLTGAPIHGCGNPNPSTIDPNDVDLLPDNALASWNYSHHRILDAWACTQGKNIEVCVIDTGVSDYQPYLNQANFDPYTPPSGRTIIKHVEMRDLRGGCGGNCPLYPQHDECKHGTDMTGIVGAPRIQGSATGVAYKANLYSIKATHDVYLNATDELRGVRDALMNVKDRTQTRIISISLGRITQDPGIRNAIIAIDGQTDKIMFAAAGTTTWFSSFFPYVVFPANHYAVHAVTGEKINGNVCSACHFGSSVEFTAVMQKPTANGPVTLARNPGMTYTGGSSAATATVAGIAALVWSKYPGESSGSILERLRLASSNYDVNAPGEGRSNTKGWGFIDVFDAVNECN